MDDGVAVRVSRLWTFTLALALLGLGGCVRSEATQVAGPTPSPTQAITASPGLEPLPLLEVEAAFPGLSSPRPVFIAHAGDGTDRLFLVLQSGRILVFPNEQSVSSADVFLDIRDRVNDSGNEEGLLGLAFDPDYAQNGHFYVYYTAEGPRRSVISRLSVRDDDPSRADPNSERVVLEVRQPYSNHNGGNILFGPDGFLYIGLGDGGAGGDPQGNGQDPETLLGSILRIDPGLPGDGRGYSIPPDNTFVGVAGFRDEIWADGFRNPWRYSFDGETGELWVGEVGQNAYEELDLVERGGNYGWNVMEGFHCFRRSAGPCDSERFQLPVVEYELTEGNCAVTGGHVYRGSRMPSLVGVYVYGDFCSGRVWGLRHDGQHVFEQRLLVDTGLQISSFGADALGELYILSFDGGIYRFASP